ncbi:MAG: hypothetical protein ACRC6X_03715 [Culicoidibacterales bacterium]
MEGYVEPYIGKSQAPFCGGLADLLSGNKEIKGREEVELVYLTNSYDENKRFKEIYLA